MFYLYLVEELYQMSREGPRYRHILDSYINLYYYNQVFLALKTNKITKLPTRRNYSFYLQSTEIRLPFIECS